MKPLDRRILPVLLALTSLSAVLYADEPIVFFNNHPNGSGAKNAVKFKDLLK